MIELELGGSAEPFAGPLDLLLAIVRRNGYPLDRLPLGEITRQFTAYLQQSNEQMLELGSDFFETASWLVLLKSRALLPRPAEGREGSPEEELRGALLAHERVQALGAFLGEQLEAAGLGPGLRAASELWSETPSDRGETQRTDRGAASAPTVHDALASARHALAAARMHAEALSAETAMTMEAALSAWTEHLAALPPGRAASSENWLGTENPAELRCLFLLALLELARLGEVWVFQPATFAPLWVRRAAQAASDRRTTKQERAGQGSADRTMSVLAKNIPARKGGV